MNVHFPDHKSLALAYSELLAEGVPRQHLGVNFDEIPNEPLLPGVHHAYLRRLHEWLSIDNRAKNSQEISGVSASPDVAPLPVGPFPARGGVLCIDQEVCDSKTIATVTSHLGEVILN